jgi:peptidoglycan/LPS O-acetylase OafA/YrhL
MQARMTTGVEPRRFAYIDALRGYAILMVIAVHASLFYNLPPTQLALAALGARGVQLFFVASAMTLFMSWHSRNDGAKAFYIRRFFRIAPMYYLCLPIFLYFDGFGPTIYAPDGLSIRHILMALTFTHGFMPDTLNSVVPGSWSIADEMIFYAIFPLLIAIRVRWLMAAALTLLATVVCVKIQQTVQPTVWAMPDTPWRVTWGTYYDLWFVNQLPLLPVRSACSAVASRGSHGPVSGDLCHRCGLRRRLDRPVPA